MDRGYVHGYEAAEVCRLHDQARTLEELLHGDTAYPAGSEVLEAGCGVGAQTIPLARRNPQARITAVDLAAGSLEVARERAAEAGTGGVRFEQADLLSLPFDDGAFDHAFVCFVLEHLADPVGVVTALRRVLRPGGTLTVIEGDHGSALFHPESEAARRAIACQVALQRAAGGDAFVGRRLYPLLAAAGFVDVRVSPRVVYADASRPDLVDGFVRRTFTAMIAGVRNRAIAAELVEAELFDEGLRDLERTTGPDGAFAYTFFKAVATRA